MDTIELGNTVRRGPQARSSSGWTPEGPDYPALRELAARRGPLTPKAARRVFQKHGRRFDASGPGDMAELCRLLTGVHRQQATAGPTRRGPGDEDRRRRLRQAEEELATSGRRLKALASAERDADRRRRRRLAAAEADLGRSRR